MKASREVDFGFVDLGNRLHPDHGSVGQVDGCDNTSYHNTSMELNIFLTNLYYFITKDLIINIDTSGP